MKPQDEKKNIELSLKCWVADDGIWLYYAVLEGFEKVKRIMPEAVITMGMKKVKTTRELREVIFGIFGSDGDDYIYLIDDVPSEETSYPLLFELENLFDTLGIEYTVIPSREVNEFCDVSNYFSEYRLEYFGKETRHERGQKEGTKGALAQELDDP